MADHPYSRLSAVKASSALRPSGPILLVSRHRHAVAAEFGEQLLRVLAVNQPTFASVNAQLRVANRNECALFVVLRYAIVPTLPHAVAAAILAALAVLVPRAAGQFAVAWWHAAVVFALVLALGVGLIVAIGNRAEKRR